VIPPLDREACLQLAETVGDAPTWPIMTHALLTGRGRAYVVGDARNFEAAVVAPNYCPDEPQAWGEPNAIWRILSELDGWTAVEVPCEVAPPLAKRVAEGRGRKIKLVDDLFFAGHAPPPSRANDSAVRLLTIDDLPMLVAAPRELSGGKENYARLMLTEGIYAAAIVDGRIVARVEAYCRTPRYANLGAYVLKEFRGRGFATAAGSLVTSAVRASGQTPVWSTSEDNLASQAVARKIGLRDIARATYVVLD
jgi:hypothetical protein